jgi:NADPH:quinone reductase-like Zn-dependent oxidoreductase
LAGTDLELPEEGVKAPEKDEWVVILGGSGSVGQYAVQVFETSEIVLKLHH